MPLSTRLSQQGSVQRSMMIVTTSTTGDEGRLLDRQGHLAWSDRSWQESIFAIVALTSSVLIDNNNRKPICRFHFNGRQKYLGTFDAEKNETRRRP